MSEQPAKPCALCGKDCSGQPRLKDAQGRYLHRACAERMQKKQAARAEGSKPAKPAASAEGANLMDALLDEAAANAPEPCPGCGRPLSRDAVVCVNCGYNATTGKTLRSSVERTRAPGAGGAALSVAGATGGAAASVVLPIVGGCVGGAIGASVWAAVAYFTHFEIGWIAWGIGFLSGAGVVAGARGNSNAFFGLLAVIIAVVSICAGKYTAFHFMVKDYVGENIATATVTGNDITDEMALESLANAITERRLDAGETLEWPAAHVEEVKQYYLEDEGEALQPEDIDSAAYAEADWPDDFPEDVRAEAQGEWDAKDPAAKRQFRYDYADRQNALMHSFASAVTSYVSKESFFETFGLWDVLWFLLAIATAFKVGSYDG